MGPKTDPSTRLDFGFRGITLSRPHRGVEQLAARRAHNPEVAGSNPAPATNHLSSLDCIYAVQATFVFLAVEVEGG
jgi:hypothetical protein